jgi:hypothetical protein
MSDMNNMCDFANNTAAALSQCSEQLAQLNCALGMCANDDSNALDIYPLAAFNISALIDTVWICGGFCNAENFLQYRATKEFALYNTTQNATLALENIASWGQQVNEEYNALESKVATCGVEKKNTEPELIAYYSCHPAVIAALQCTKSFLMGGALDTQQLVANNITETQTTHEV